MKKKKKNPCNCIEETNKKLEKHGLELDLVYAMSGRTSMQIAVVRKVKGAKMQIVIGSYCPICGKPVQP